MDWGTVGKTVGMSGILIVVIGYLIRSLFQQLLSFDLEKHKNDLGKETERFRHELSITAYEHQVRFSALHVKRAEVIAELYNRLTQVVRYAGNLMVDTTIDIFVSSKDDSIKKANDSYNSLFEYFQTNQSISLYTRNLC